MKVHLFNLSILLILFSNFISAFGSPPVQTVHFQGAYVFYGNYTYPDTPTSDCYPIGTNFSIWADNFTNSGELLIASGITENDGGGYDCFVPMNIYIPWDDPDTTTVDEGITYTTSGENLTF